MGDVTTAGNLSPVKKLPSVQKLTSAKRVNAEQIKQARQIDVLDYILAYEPNNIKRVGSGYRMRDHPSIEIKSGKWRWYSRGLYGRTALDYLTNVRGYGFVEAVCLLLGERAKQQDCSLEGSDRYISNSAAKLSLERLPFTLPLHNKDNRRVIAYLQSRGIDRQLIDDCVNRGQIYERANTHDCVFTGKDEHGKIRFAAMRSTTSTFKRDADGSEKYGFVLPPSDPSSTIIAAFESPIDSLSHQTLCKQGFIPPFDGWRLALGGTSILSLEHFIKHHPKVTHCFICSDNDEAGEMIATKIAKLPGISSERSPPVGGNDYNDMLQAMQKAERIKSGPARLLSRGLT